MKISDDTYKVIEFLNSASSSGLRKKNDLSTILEIGATYSQFDQFNNILFNAASYWNIEKTLKKQHPADASIDKLVFEQQKITTTLIKDLKNFIQNEDNETISRFEKIYFKETRGCIENLTDLCHDFSILNSVKKTMKEKQNQQ